MGEEFCRPKECLDIFVKRILAKYAATEQILFQTPDNKRKERLDICICNKEEGPVWHELKCIKEIKVIECDADQEIICNHKARLTIKFKVMILAQFGKCKFDCIILPDDIGTKVCVKPGALPARIDNDETLKISECGHHFVWTKDVPLTKFDEPIPPEVFDDPTLSSHLLIRKIRFAYDVLGECPFPCACPGAAASAPVDLNGNSTEVQIGVDADLLDKLGIDQDIYIEGIPFDC